MQKAHPNQSSHPPNRNPRICASETSLRVRKTTGPHTIKPESTPRCRCPMLCKKPWYYRRLPPRTSDTVEEGHDEGNLQVTTSKLTNETTGFLDSYKKLKCLQLHDWRKPTIQPRRRRRPTKGETNTLNDATIRADKTLPLAKRKYHCKATTIYRGNKLMDRKIPVRTNPPDRGHRQLYQGNLKVRGPPALPVGRKARKMGGIRILWTCTQMFVYVCSERRCIVCLPVGKWNIY